MTTSQRVWFNVGMDEQYKINTSRVTLPVNVAGIVRDVEFTITERADGSKFGYSGPVFTARVGRGTKTHNCHMQLVIEDHDRLRRLGYNVNHGSMVELDGQWYGLKSTTTILNRQARITGWRQDAEATSRHIMER